MLFYFISFGNKQCSRKTCPKSRLSQLVILTDREKWPLWNELLHLLWVIFNFYSCLAWVIANLQLFMCFFYCKWKAYHSSSCLLSLTSISQRWCLLNTQLVLNPIFYVMLVIFWIGSYCCGYRGQDRYLDFPTQRYVENTTNFKNYFGKCITNATLVAANKA